jgi:hypothetical protein
VLSSEPTWCRKKKIAYRKTKVAQENKVVASNVPKALKLPIMPLSQLLNNGSKQTCE